jgi:pimeloyl-ACP methyl ester carboxylesterase
MWMKTIASLFCCIASFAACQPSTSQGPANAPTQTSPNAETLWLQANGLRLKINVYRSAKLSSHPILIVVLHGDSPFKPPSYQYAFARKAAMKMDDVVVAALLRPGYADDTGDRSQGERGRTTGDNYTPEVVDAVAQAIDQLKAKFHPAGTVLVGHSGGAAITGNVLGRWPSAVNAGFLVACPCDLAAWREHMRERQSARVWSEPVTSLSPIKLADQVKSSVHVRLLVGSNDPVTPTEFTQRYAKALQKHGDDVTVTIAPGLEHDILLESVAFDGLSALVETVKKDSGR